MGFPITYARLHAPWSFRPTPSSRRGKDGNVYSHRQRYTISIKEIRLLVPVGLYPQGPLVPTAPPRTISGPHLLLRSRTRGPCSFHLPTPSLDLGVWASAQGSFRGRVQGALWSVQAARTGYPGPGLTNNRHFRLRALEAASPQSRLQQTRCLLRPPSWFTDGRLLTVLSHGGRGKGF